MERLWVKDVQVGHRASGTYLVVRKQQGKGRNEKPYLRLMLQDKTGQLDARVWDRVEELASLFEEGDRVQVEGQVASFQGRPQLTVERLEKSQEDRDPADFELEASLPGRGAGDGSVALLREELGRVGDPFVRALLLSFIDDPDLAAKLAKAPAAKEIHHAYQGGLAEHILSCVRLAQRLADHYPMADRDLLVAGAFLHDLGKVSELSWEKGGTTYTDEGRLVGHLVLTAQWIHERAKVITGFPKDLELHLVHLVLAHHGRLEYGSPKLPHTIEAFLVHALDEIDSRMNQMLGQMARTPGERWAEPQKHWERLVWKDAAPTEAGKERGAPWRQGRRRREKKRKEGRAPETRTAAPARPAEERAPERPRREPAERREAAERREGPKREAPRREAPKKEEEKLTFKPFFQLPGQEAPQAEEAAQAIETRPEEVVPPPSAPAEPTEVHEAAPAEEPTESREAAPAAEPTEPAEPGESSGGPEEAAPKAENS